MVGQIQIIAYMLAVYLVYKGYEILQIALVSPKEKKTFEVIAGFVALTGSVLLAIGFIYMMDEQASRIGNSPFGK
jgi:hypothetical protein